MTMEANMTLDAVPGLGEVWNLNCIGFILLGLVRAR